MVLYTWVHLLENKALDIVDERCNHEKKVVKYYPKFYWSKSRGLFNDVSQMGQVKVLEI